MRGNETPGRIVVNFCTGVVVHDVITSANFYDCRLWGLSAVGGQILGFSIDLSRRPYNTLELPGTVRVCVALERHLLLNDNFVTIQHQLKVVQRRPAH